MQLIKSKDWKDSDTNWQFNLYNYFCIWQTLRGARVKERETLFDPSHHQLREREGKKERRLLRRERERLP